MGKHENQQLHGVSMVSCSKWEILAANMQFTRFCHPTDTAMSSFHARAASWGDGTLILDWLMVTQSISHYITLLVGGFKHFFIFHFIYGMSSFPLTNSTIFQDGFFNHQPDDITQISCDSLSDSPYYIYIWLVVWNIFCFSIYWEFNHPSWRSHIFQRGGSTTN